jgi:hypothetical protein
MSELPDRRSDRLPVRPDPPRQLFDRDHSYGVAQDLERMKAGLAPTPRTPRIRTRSRRIGGGPMASARRWWASGNSRPVDLWHRVRCRTGHHDFRGGHQIQLGSRFEFVERRCIWCDALPSS